MDYEIPIKIKDENNIVCDCAMRTEYDDSFCYFLSNIPTFDGRCPGKPETQFGFIYSWRLRDYRNDENWVVIFKGKQKEIKEKLKQSKTLYEFFSFFGFEWPLDAHCDFKIIHKENIFEEIEL